MVTITSISRAPTIVAMRAIEGIRLVVVRGSTVTSRRGPGMVALGCTPLASAAQICERD
jgi:hypothetical protein